MILIQHQSQMAVYLVAKASPQDILQYRNVECICSQECKTY